MNSDSEQKTFCSVCNKNDVSEDSAYCDRCNNYICNDCFSIEGQEAMDPGCLLCYGCQDEMIYCELCSMHWNEGKECERCNETFCDDCYAHHIAECDF